MIPPRDRGEFLAEFRLRNRGLISDSDQTALSEARFLVAGCGSTGGAAIEPLVRAGAMRMILVEPGSYELHNLNRQRATLDAIGCNKAAWLAKDALAINPYLDLEIVEIGLHHVEHALAPQQDGVGHGSIGLSRSHEVLVDEPGVVLSGRGLARSEAPPALRRLSGIVAMVG